ncbi:MAG: alpha/beta hydrolase [Pseudomonadota bacterium]
MTEIPTFDFVTVEGLKIHYRILGEGPPVIALHGAAGNLLDWEIGPARELAKRHRVLLLDRPGFGFSERPANGHELSVQARILASAAQKVGFPRAILIGQSFGGAVALAWALERPDSVAGLCLIAAPSHLWPGGVGPLYTTLSVPVIGPVLAHVLPRMAPESRIEGRIARIFHPAAPPEGYLERIGVSLSLRPKQLRAAAMDLTRLKPQIRAMVPHYPSLKMPVEILHGKADRVVLLRLHSRPLARAVPDARFTRLPGQGHMLHHTATPTFLDAVGRLAARTAEANNAARAGGHA